MQSPVDLLNKADLHFNTLFQHPVESDLFYYLFNKFLLSQADGIQKCFCLENLFYLIYVIRQPPPSKLHTVNTSFMLLLINYNI